MSALLIAILVVVALVSFLGGFIMGSSFTKGYLRANGLLLDEPNPAKAHECGDGSCDCEK